MNDSPSRTDIEGAKAKESSQEKNTMKYTTPEQIQTRRDEILEEQKSLAKELKALRSKEVARRQDNIGRFIKNEITEQAGQYEKTLKKRENNISKFKIYYWIAVFIFVIIFILLSGIDFSESNYNNRVVQTLLVGLVSGIFLNYYNLFRKDNIFYEHRVKSSLAYIACFCGITLIYRLPMYLTSSYFETDVHYSSGYGTIFPVAVMIGAFAGIFINDGE
ncbi:MAG: hypothetical protein LBT23_07100 [Synergistaceae bacterium]|jgi:hypothetical protein|nr:hypothetical protein [Synergistaceae bacterium]